MYVIHSHKCYRDRQNHGDMSLLPLIGFQFRLPSFAHPVKSNTLLSFHMSLFMLFGPPCFKFKGSNIFMPSFVIIFI